MKKGFNCYRNEKFFAFIEGRSLAACKRKIKQTETNTHMGQWHRTLTIQPENIKATCFEYNYSTTIGVYYAFKPAFLGEGI